MRCGAVLGSGAQCGRETKPKADLCPYHRSIQIRREAHAFHLTRLSAEDQEALAPAAGLEGVDYEIAMLRVLIRRTLRDGDIDALRRGIDSLCRALQTKHRLDARATHSLGAALEAALESLGCEPDASTTPSPAPQGQDDRGVLQPAAGLPPLPLGEGWGEGWAAGPAREIEATALALRYQGGEPEALELLHRLLEVAILAVLLHEHAFQPPSAMTLQDLQDHGRIVLAQLAQRWRPGVSFLGYFSRTFPPAIARHVRAAAQGRDSRGDSQASAPPPTAGPARPQHSALSTHDSPLETPDAPFSGAGLASLPELERQIVLLRSEAQDMRGIARQVGVTVVTAYKLYQRACARLEGRTPSSVDPASIAMRRLVQVLHLAAGPDGQLPSREWAVAAAGLKRLEYDQLIARLEGAHAIYGRRQRVPGHLLERDPAATLARVTGGQPR